MERRPNPEKIKFLRESMDQMDYKSMRDLLKLLLVEKFDKMYCQLSEYQHQQLEPIEEVSFFKFIFNPKIIIMN
jgi:hypothetical protein